MSRNKGRGVICGVSSSHQLDKDNVTIKNEALLNYAKQINPEFKSTTRVCRTCHEKVKASFLAKLRRYRAAKKLMSANTVSTSNEKSSTNSEESSSSILRNNVGEKPSSQLIDCSLSESQSTSRTASRAAPTTTAKRKRDDSSPMPTDDKSISSNSSLDVQPTTSAAASAARQARTARSVQAVASPSSDDESDVGINVRLGKRLPGVQPAPRRRRVVLEPVAMDMYLQGITGG